MNENIDLTKILDGCPKGTKFYHVVFGAVSLLDIRTECVYPIRFTASDNCCYAVNRTGISNIAFNGECVLFPSKDQRDWSKFERFWDKPKKEKLDVNTLQGNNMNNIDKLKKISTPAEENWFKIAEEWEREDKEMDKLKHEVVLPDGYIFKDGNGNIINTTKIVLEKKKEKYPKTYEECCEILGVNSDNFLTITNYYDGEVETTDYERGLLNNIAALWYLLICRDAYWKIANDWKEKRKEESRRYVIYSTLSGKVEKSTMIDCTANDLLDFPTEEMRDAFYENFKELIERCKELL